MLAHKGVPLHVSGRFLASYAEQGGGEVDKSHSAVAAAADLVVGGSEVFPLFGDMYDKRHIET